MDFNESIESLKSIAADAAQAAARKAKALAFIAKANVSIHAEQERQRRYYAELGKLYYRDFITAEEPDEAEYLPWCDKLTDSLKKVEDLKAAIEREKEADPEVAEAADAAEPLDAELREVEAPEAFREDPVPEEVPEAPAPEQTLEVPAPAEASEPEAPVEVPAEE